MGDLTRADIREEVSAGLGNRTDLTAPVLNRAIRLAERRIDGFAPWRELWRTTAVSQDLGVTVTSTRADYFLPVGGPVFGAQVFTDPVITVAASTMQMDTDDGANFEVGELFAVVDEGLAQGISFHVVDSINADLLGFSPSLRDPISGVISFAATETVTVYKLTPVWEVERLEMAHNDGSDVEAWDLHWLPPEAWAHRTDVPVSLKSTTGHTSTRPHLFTVQEWDFPRLGRAGQVLSFWPAPNFIYALRARYRKRVTPMSSDTARSEFRAKDEAIIALARHGVFQRLGQPEDAAREFNVARGVLTELLAREQPNQPIRGRRQDRAGHVDDLYWADPFHTRHGGW